MRNISAAALSVISTARGIEPINIVKITWTNGGQDHYYSDRAMEGIEGKILELSNLENVINVSKSSSSQNISLKLDDTDGSIKAIFDYNDIHKRPVKVYQWFSELPIGDKFLIFEGEISSPIIWNEGDRVLSFDVVSKIEDKEIGFSVEEGEFDEIPHDLIGKAWPLPFGTCAKVPCIQLDPIPRGVTAEGTGIHDSTLDDELPRLNDIAIKGRALAQDMFLAALQSYMTAIRVSGSIFSPDPEYENLGDQYTEKGNEYLRQVDQAVQEFANLHIQLQRQKQYEKTGIRIIGGDTFPQGETLEVDLNGSAHTGRMSGDTFNIDTRSSPGLSNTIEDQVTEVPLQTTSPLTGNPNIVPAKGQFFWIAGGSKFRVTSNIPIRYIVAMLPVSIINVFAYRNYGDTRILTIVPSSYYTIYNQTFGPINATFLELSRPLSSYDQGWDDSLYVDLTSPIGPNTVDILIWMIQNYTNLSYDSTSFNATKTALIPFPSNFCLFDRKNIVQVLNEIAFQARCAIWLKEGVFYMRYLVDEPSPVEDIEETDIIANTLEIHHTSTEEIVTKIIAEYQVDYEKTEKSKVILRNNVPKYGTQEESHDWYIYTTPEMVLLAATFWLIRKSNTWKYLNFKTPLNKLRIETFDPIDVDLSGNYAVNGNVTGIVESASFDSSDLSLSFNVWLPVRLGEMHKYNFAWPIDDAVNVYPNSADLVTAGSGGPGEQAKGSLKILNGVSPQRIKFLRDKKNPHRGDTNPGRKNPDTSVAVVTGNYPVTFAPAPRFDYDYRSYNLAPFAPELQERKVLPGLIVSGDGPDYQVKVYPRGLSGATRTIKVRCLNHTAKLPASTWIIVIFITWKEKDRENREITKMENIFIDQQNSSCFPGVVLSGSGIIYNVAVYKQGLTITPVTIEARQLQIDPADFIPVGTWCLVSEVRTPIGLQYYIQVPVWLE